MGRYESGVRVNCWHKKPESKLQERYTDASKIQEKTEPQKIVPAVQLSTPMSKSVELTTLTEISNKPQEFPFIEQKTTPLKNTIIDEILKSKEKTDEKIEIIRTSYNPELKSETHKQEIIAEQIQSINPPQVEQNNQKPTIKLPEEEKIEDDEDDLSRIKGEIMKALSRLEQAEVE